MPHVLWGVACFSLPGPTTPGEVAREFREALSLCNSPGPGRSPPPVELYRLVPVAEGAAEALGGEERVVACLPDSNFGSADIEDIYRQRDDLEMRYERVRESLLALLEAVDWTEDAPGQQAKLRCQTRTSNLSKEIMHVLCQEIRTLREQKQSAEKCMKEQMDWVETMTNIRDLKQEFATFNQCVQRKMEEKASGSEALRSGVESLAATIEATAADIYAQSPGSAGLGRCLQAVSPQPALAAAAVAAPVSPACVTPPVGLLRCSSEAPPPSAPPPALGLGTAGGSSPSDSEATEAEAEAEAVPPLGLRRARPVVPRLSGLGSLAAAAAAAAATEGLPSDRSPGVTTTSASSTSRTDRPISARSPGSSGIAFAALPLSARTPSARTPGSGGMAMASARTPGSGGASARSPGGGAVGAGPGSGRYAGGPASARSSGGGNVALANPLAGGAGSASARAQYRRVAPLQLATPRQGACPNLVGPGCRRC